MNILITGGAGFIGQHVAHRLVSSGFNVKIYDNLHEQIHGDVSPAEIETKIGCEVIKADILDYEKLSYAVGNCDALIHLAAETGTGQSMYELSRYCKTNVVGTANILENLTKHGVNISKIILASSRSVYGEGKYKCKQHGVIYPNYRRPDNLRNHNFEHTCELCGDLLEVCATDESSKINPLSIYAATKLQQEQLISIQGKALGISTSTLRFQNVYGPGQSLKNPYTGILSIFTTLLKENKEINIFEDGLESRDFVFIDDVVETVCDAIKMDGITNEVVNVGTGMATSVIQVAEELRDLLGSKSDFRISGDYRIGDIRHNYSCNQKHLKLFSREPKTTFSYGIKKFVHWAQTQSLNSVHYEQSINELRKFKIMSTEK